MFDTYLRRWDLVPDGGPILSASGGVLPVTRHAQPAMLKVATCDEERRGNALMTWWNGNGAARVWLHDRDAVLLERACATPTLGELSAAGHDDDAIRIACDAVARLHAHRAPQPPATVPLRDWFHALLAHAHDDGHDEVLRVSAEIAQRLLAAPVDEAVLHGDIHHRNVLNFGDRGWLAIDPKGLHGERAFDYANLFCNPAHDLAVDRARFERRVALVADAAQIDRQRLLQWIVAWAGLSAVWSIDDGRTADTPLQVAMLAARSLGLK
ncbi:TPA: 3'-kinase [Burkholderia vietnamiensis]|uniref:3'-kinase n=1 Tax=Burkholderia vietnamiensis TaxID=60552 RepID=A0AA45BC45_BURVI|nr:aminoglycoside phosphotransferase family protein [Burkholderia vietnamiensis]KVS11022.1 3'-kinase [Burkholderia vietnamiensis]MCA8206143.1 3'-kinase [Burkholderia vietnamiensis]PRH41265.1 3'-kinase [Burkholderia vietnamiensis]HDR9102033.1 3'-kinase [Burkholderia vietnamiensis]HDR9103245.1 3'-kinase [Burkholderia vietnamiensis]